MLCRQRGRGAAWGRNFIAVLQPMASQRAEMEALEGCSGCQSIAGHRGAPHNLLLTLPYKSVSWTDGASSLAEGLAGSTGVVKQPRQPPEDTAMP